MKLRIPFPLPFAFLSGYDIFISYTRADAQEYAGKLFEQLSSLDYSCFIDKKEVPGGRSLNSSLKAALRGSKTLILIGTERALEREYVQLEFAEFSKTTRPIIPINVASALASPKRLSTQPWNVIKDRDLVWIDETEEAVKTGLPSPAVYEGVQNLFQFTRRNVVRRRWTSVALVTIFIASLAAVWQARNANVQAQNAKTQETLAEQRKLEVEEQTKKLLKTKGDLDISTNNLKEEQRKLGKTNEELKGKTNEALANAEKARQQEIVALRNAEKATQQQKLAESRYLADQGRREYENNPLLGLALSLEAWQSVPASNQAAHTEIERAIQERMKYGRIARLDQGDFESPYFLKGLPFLVLGRTGKAGELRDASTGALIQTLAGEVADVKDIFDRNVYKLGDLPYFVIEYKDAPTELRRAGDGSVVLAARIGSVRHQFEIADPYLRVSFKDAPSELRLIKDDKRAIQLSGRAGEDEFVYAVAGAPYFLVTYKKGADKKQLPAELRRADTGQIVETMNQKLSGSPLEFSHDYSYFTINSEPEFFKWASDLRRTDTRQTIKFTGKTKQVFFSPETNNFVVSYEDAPSELRSTDGQEVVNLSGNVTKVVFGHSGQYLLVLYDEAASEIRRVDSGEVISTQPEIKRAGVTKKGLAFDQYFFVTYKNDKSGLLRVNDGKLVSSMVSFSTDLKLYDDRRLHCFIAEDPATSVTELHRADTGEKLRLPEQLSNDATLHFLREEGMFGEHQEGPYLVVESDSNHRLVGLINSETGQVTTVVTDHLYHDIGFSPRGSYFILPQSPAELRRSETGELIATIKDLSREVLEKHFFFSPNEEVLVINRKDAPAELFRSGIGKPFAELSGKVVDATFNANSSLVILKYKNAPAELRRTDSGEILANISAGYFSEDGRYAVITFDNNRSELWVEQGFSHRITDLGTGLAGLRFDLNTEHGLVWYKDRRAYLLDLKWLNAMNGTLEKLSSRELIGLACQPLLSSKFDAQALAPFVAGAPFQVCH